MKLNDRKFKDLVQPEDYKLIPLTQGKFAKVDNEDFDRVKGINWCHCTKYAYNKTIKQMHRYIMNCPDNMVVDHINGDTLDNRKSNLRIITKQENSFNQKPRRGTSKHLGVSYDKSRGKWVAEIKHNYKKIFIGRFDTEHEAVVARDNKAIELFGDLARLNNIDNG